MKNEMDDFQSKSSEIRQLAALDPSSLSEYLTGINEGLDSAAPNFAPHMYASAINAIQYLASKLPASAPQFLQDELAGISAPQKMKWLNIYEVADDPFSVFDFIEEGTLTDDQVLAVKTIYPVLYQEMSTKMLEYLGKMKEQHDQLPYAQRLASAKFIGTPLDNTMTLPSMQSILKAASANTGPAAEANRNPKKTQPSKHSQPSAAVLRQINKTDSLYPTQNQALEISHQK